MSAASATRIRHLNLHGPRAQEQRPSLEARLHAMSWPESAPGEQLFVRRLAVRGTADLEGALRRQLDELLRSPAAPAADGGEGATPSAVRFPSRAAMIAAQVTDLLAGRLTRRWYWRRWHPLAHRERGEALAALLGEAPLELPAVCDLLAERGALAPLWQALTPAAAMALIARLERESALPLPRPEEGAAAVETAPMPEETVAAHRPAPLPAAARRQWRSPLAALPSRNDPRRRLALYLAVLRWRPTLLRAPDAARRLAALGAELEPRRHSPAPPRMERPQRSDTPAPRPEAPPIVSDDAAARAEEAPRREADSTADAPPRPGSEERRGGAGDPPAGAGGGESPASAPSETRTADTLPSGASDSRAEREIFTPRGALLYLLNLLERLDPDRWLAEAEAAAPEGAPWRLLRAMGLRWGMEESDPLARFLLGEAGLDPDAPPPEHELTTLAERLLREGEALYPRELPWGPELIEVPGRLLTTASHLDLILPLPSVRLEARLVGLDLDPGWLPWLGRVVAFHFREEPTP